MNNIDEIFSRLASTNPDPRSELEYTNYYTFLVAVILSAQTTDVGVNKATRGLFKIVSTPEDMINLGEENLKSHIKTIGLFNAKAKNVMALSKILIEKFHSKVPETFDELVSLPGVGIKSANVFLNSMLNHPVIAVDTHVFRVAHRIGLSKATAPEKVGIDLEKIIPEQWKVFANHSLVLHGRYICKAKKPMCEKCPISDLCDYYRDTRSN
jgi:endonuclease-3